jgi:hypothetical protein
MMPATDQPGVMAGGGFYNEHSAPQHSAAGFGLAMLQAAATSAPLPADGQPFLIADYGAAQGRNSLGPMRTAIAAVRARAAAGLPISVVHTDIPGNDFSALFTLLARSPQSYLADAADVFAYTAGQSFYRRLFPPAQVCLGWSAIAVHWLSGAPCTVPGHIWAPFGPAEVRAAFARQAADDWVAFLGHRAAELRPGGRLVVVGGAADDAGDGGADGLMDLANTALRQLVTHGRLSEPEYARMVVPTWNRRPADYLAPFGTPAAAGLTVEAQQFDILPDRFWAAYQSSGDTAAYAGAYADFFAAAFTPSLLSALDPARPDRERAALAAALDDGLRRLIAEQPAKATTHWRLLTLHLAKPG